jgi:hypothetical protein
MPRSRKSPVLLKKYPLHWVGATSLSTHLLGRSLKLESFKSSIFLREKRTLLILTLILPGPRPKALGPGKNRVKINKDSFLPIKIGSLTDMRWAEVGVLLPLSSGQKRYAPTQRWQEVVFIGRTGLFPSFPCIFRGLFTKLKDRM